MAVGEDSHLNPEMICPCPKAASTALFNNLKTDVETFSENLSEMFS